jgi:branched-chain amino acid transport system ATP-binding protein
MGEEAILVASGLRKTFGGLRAVDSVDLSVRRGSIHALIGPNGAGKTTFFNLLTRFLPLSSGTIVYDGRDITHRSPAEVATLGLIRSFQLSAVFPNLTALENVRVALQRRRGQSFDFWRSGARLRQYDEEARRLLEEVGLAGHAESSPNELSYGRKRALEIATTLALDPKLMLLDEPTAGMGREDVDRISALIKRVAVDRTILMVEHNLSVVRLLSDTITVLARGRIVAEGDYDSVSRDPVVIEAYLGSSHE